MRKTALGSILFAGAMLAVAVIVEAQQPKKIPRIGYLAGNLTTITYRIDAFRQGLRQLGYAEGKDIVIESRSAEGKLDRLNELAAELVRLKVNVIVTGGAPPTRAAKAATATIPIVMTQDPDPVGNGFIASLAHPGGNITGLSNLAPETSGKQLELLKEIVPKLSRIAVLWTSTVPGHPLQLREIGLAAGPLNVQLQSFDVLGPKDIDTAFQAASNQRAEAFIVFGGAILAAQRTRILEYVVKNRLPAIYATQPFMEAGGLMSYGVDLTDLDRRAATYVDRILKGAKPADLPVEQPKKFELVINLKTAKQIGITIPPNVLAKADKVIK
ncbi:MAG TPA: ABC transporter substrate-binding protein [Candidatus Limnocylindrales bacterium]|jgi:putative ABC transport system substrate-binding protein|nr:ABC transporter substrate-binding protein [Candidatus Limnocylindrales bacterium]